MQRQLVRQPVHEQRPAGQARDGVVVRLVHPVDRLRVGQRQAHVLGEGPQELLVGGGVRAVPAQRADDQAAAGRTALVHRGRDDRAEPARYQRAGRRYRLAVEHGGDEPVLDDGPSDHTRLRKRYRRHPGGLLLAQPAPGDQPDPVGVGRLAQPQRHHLVPEQVLRGAGDGGQDLGQRLAAGDRPLDVEQVLQQPLPLGERGEQPGVLGGLPLAALAHLVLGRDGPQHGQGQVQQPGHATDQVQLLHREVLPGAGQHEMARVRAGPGRAHRVAVADPGQGDDAQPAGGHRDEGVLRYRAGREADRGRHPPVHDDRGDLRLQRLGGPLGGGYHGGGLVRQ